MNTAQTRATARVAVALLAIASILAVAGSAQGQVPSFGKSVLSGGSSSNPTSLQFGPDGLLYVGQQNGLIKVYDVVRNAANDYSVLSTETITLIQSIPNHNDDGTVNGGVNSRLLTGILVTGTAANPVVYVSSSDPRIDRSASANVAR